MNSDVEFDGGEWCVCMCVFMYVCLKGSKMKSLDQAHPGMYDMQIFIIHGHAYTWRSYDISLVLIAVGPYLVGSQIIISAIGYKVFAAIYHSTSEFSSSPLHYMYLYSKLGAAMVDKVALL